MTVIELIESGAAQLAHAGVSFGHGTTNAFDEVLLGGGRLVSARPMLN